MTRPLLRFALLAPLAAAACTVAPPTGPSVVAMPRQGENFAQFQAQDINCRNYASGQIGYGDPARAANQSAVGSAVLGTALGAAAGAALGSIGGNAGAGAAIGGAGGLLAGGAIGSSNARTSAASLQQRYDIAYTQCMVAGGYTVQQPSYPVPVYSYPAPTYYYGPTVSYGVGRTW
ncbi:Glycine zipper family protein [Rhodovastum atsumiense]|uniref:glycine zipper family protein n=1 Tax=Rhodovastum atsumiense TaxID=504468 RepID=UPI00193C6979|nr:glycine zipper family protein [Rhodovastum atsumiense]CAH2604680.1 Glycine zipper family protein [Rhodovastum atsumiense]